MTLYDKASKVFHLNRYEQESTKGIKRIMGLVAEVLEGVSPCPGCNCVTYTVPRCGKCGGDKTI